jgi:hypothetical protein
MNRRHPEFMPLRFSGSLAPQVSLRARRAGRRALGKTLKMLPLGVAIIDDLLAIVVIAFFTPRSFRPWHCCWVRSVWLASLL